MFRPLLFTFTSVILSAIPAQAATVSLSGYFSGFFDPSGPGYQGVSTLFGSWAFSYDDSTVPSSGSYQQTIPLASFSANAIGLTTFTTANTSALVTFSNGQRTGVWIGGSTSGVQYSDSEVDDFSVGYASPTQVMIMSLSVGSLPGASMSFNRSGTYSVVPEPSVSLLGAIGVLALLNRRRN